MRGHAGSFGWLSDSAYCSGSGGCQPGRRIAEDILGGCSGVPGGHGLLDLEQVRGHLSKLDLANLSARRHRELLDLRDVAGDLEGGELSTGEPAELRCG